MTAITTSVPIATVLAANPAIEVIVCPGHYDPRDGSLYGTHTVEFIRRFNATHVFLGASALGVEGPSDANSAAVAIKQAMIERAAMATLLVDHSKYERTALERICAVKSLDRIVCDAPLPEDIAEAARKHGLAILVEQG
jgi:DeoR/GlpR family transcriptional regulator of sugar metabolism